MNTAKNQNGSSLIVALLGLLFIGVVAFAGYRLMEQSTPTGKSDSVTKSSAKVPDTFDDSADLKKASNALDNTAIDGDVNPSSTDAELDAVL